MPEWLGKPLPAEGEVPVEWLAGRLVVAAVLGAVVAAVYFRTMRKQRAEAAPFVSTLVLLTILIAMVTVVIGGSLARAFGLVAVLSIVRFRTVVDDTRDTSFVIFAVAVGMAVGAGYVALAAAGVPVVGVAAWLLSLWGGPSATPGRCVLTVRVGLGVNPDAALGAVLGRFLVGHRLLSATTARQGAALDLTYAAGLKPGQSPADLIGELNKTEGVQGVEWKEAGDTR